MNHNLTLSDALARFVLIEEAFGCRVSTMELSEGLLELYWEDEFGYAVTKAFDETQIVETDGNNLYATDDEGGIHTFNAYTIVNFSDELPPQS